MASSLSAVSSGRKKNGKRVLPHPPSNRKLTMKHIELDRDNELTTISRDRADYLQDELFRVTKIRSTKGETEFTFTGVKQVLADIELTPAQDRILKDMLQFTNESIEEWMKDAVLGRLHADIDQYYSCDDSRREPAYKAAETWKIRR